MEVNGMAHVMLTVSNYEACVPFYEKLLPFLGLKFVVRKTDSQFYCVGGPHRRRHPQGRCETLKGAFRAIPRGAASRVLSRPRAQGYR